MSFELKNGLEKHIDGLRQRQAEIELQIQNLVDESHAIKQRIDSAVQLYEAEFGQLVLDLAGKEILPESDSTQQKRWNFRGMSIADACAYILNDVQRPTHVSDLVSILSDGGLEMNSLSPERTVATTLYRNKQKFRKTSPGTFVLIGAATKNIDDVVAKEHNAVGLVQGAYQILKEYQKPMHVKDIVEQLIARGAKYKTKRPTAMLSGSLRKSKSKFRPCGGDVWALAEWDKESNLTKEVIENDEVKAQ